jgi:hypothetical protein
MVIFNLKKRGNKLEDFQAHRDDLIQQYVSKIGGSSKATYVMGQKVSEGSYQIERIFKDSMKKLADLCLLSTGLQLNGEEPEKEESVVDVIKSVT